MYQPITTQYPLHRLAKICDWGGLRKAIDKANQDQIETTDEYGMNVIHWAVTEANIPIGLLEYLTRVFPHGVRQYSNGGFLPLHLALMAGASVTRIQRLVESFPRSTMMTIPTGHTPYMIYEERLPMDTQALKRADGQQNPAAHGVHVWGTVLVMHVLKTSSWRSTIRKKSGSMSSNATTQRLSMSSSSTSFLGSSPIYLRSESSMNSDEQSLWSFDNNSAYDWKEFAHRMNSDDNSIDDLADDKHRLLTQAISKAPYDVFDWIVRICSEYVRVRNGAGLLPLHVAVTQGVSTRRLRRLIDAYPESIHVVTKQGDSPWTLGQKMQLEPTALDVLRLGNKAIYVA